MEDPWFVYQRTAGRITARPVNAKGWLALLALIALPPVIVLTLGGLVMAVHPLLFAALLVVSLGSALWLLFRLMRRKGRLISTDA
jgi:hypothetical protein